MTTQLKEANICCDVLLPVPETGFYVKRYRTLLNAGLQTLNKAALHHYIFHHLHNHSPDSMHADTVGGHRGLRPKVEDHPYLEPQPLLLLILHGLFSSFLSLLSFSPFCLLPKV